MRRLLLLALSLVLAAPAGAGAQAADEAMLFAGGGTSLTNGVFFPGTGLYDGEKYITAAPLEVKKGQNVLFTNLDAGVVTNVHQIRSYKKRKNGRSWFQSASVNGPGQSVMITSHVPVGLYKYLCTTHGGMVGFLEIVR